MAAQYDGTIRINTKIDSGGFLKGLQKMSSQSKKLNNSISETTNQIDRLKKEIGELQNAPLESSSINKISADIDTIENKLASLYEKRGILEEEVASMFGGVGSKMIPDQAFLQSMMKNNGEWKKLTADIDKTELSLEKYENKLKQAQATEQKKTDNQIEKKSILLEKACNKLDVYKTKLSEINGSESGIAKKLSHISDVARGAFGNFTKHASKSNNTLNKLSGSVTRFGKRIWGLLSSALVFSVLTKAFTTLREKMAAAVKQNAQFSASLSKISGNMNSAFNNLLSAAMPALNAIISAIAKATSYLSTFIALLTGKTVKSSNAAADAANNQASAVGGVGEAAKKASEYLNGYDEMNVQASKDSAGGSGGGGTGSDITYEDADVSSQVADFLDRIKAAWEDADFTDFGRIVGDKINDSLEDIDWTKIKNTSYKIGKSVATFLNGVFETPDLFTNVGKTVAESLNTAIELSLGFAENFHWDSFGQALADSINEFFDTFEFDTAAESVNAWIKGVLKAASNMLKKTDFEEIRNKIGTFLTTLDFTKFIGGLADVIWQAIKDAFILLEGLFEEAPLETSLITAFAVLKFTGLGSAVAGQISKAISTYLGINGLSLALKGVGMVVALEGITIALTGETNLKNTITSSASSGIGTLMVTKNLEVALAVSVAVASFEFGKYLYEHVPAVEKWADLIVNTIGDLITGNFDIDKEKKMTIDLAVELGIPQLEAKLTIIHAQITGWFTKNAIELSVKITAFTVAIASKVIDFVANLIAFTVAIAKRTIDFVANLVSWIKNSTFGQTIGDMIASFSKHKKTKGFSDTIGDMMASFSDRKKGKGFSDTIGDMMASFSKHKKAKGFSSTIGSMKAKLTSFTDAIKNKVLSFTAKITGTTGAKGGLVGFKAGGGVYSNGKWKPITQYASGGFPDMGQMFIARERGAELVGTLGGHTAVMNNDQIVASVAAGVFEAVSAAMANSNSGTGDISVYVGGQKITDYVIKDVKNRTIASGGKNPLLI